MLFLRSLWKTKFYFLFVTALLLFTTQIWEPQWILTLPGIPCFYSGSEQIIPFVVLLPVSFLLYDDFEIELALVNGVTTMKLMLCKFFAALIATLLPLFLVILPLREKYYWYSPEEVTIPIEGGTPAQYRLYFLLSGFVTVFFFAALFLFLRVVLRNCYAPVGLGVLAYSLFQNHNMDVHYLSVPFRNALFDPFITRYLIGDKIANEGFTVPTGKVVEAVPHLWTYNRLLFFGIAVVLLAVTCMLLRREKLHESFGD